MADETPSTKKPKTAAAAAELEKERAVKAGEKLDAKAKAANDKDQAFVKAKEDKAAAAAANGKDSKDAKKDDKKDDKKDVKGGKDDKKDVKGLDEADKKEEFVMLVSSEKKEYKVNRRAAIQSTLVKTALEEDKEAKDVQLIHISGAIVEKVIAYMNYHMDVEPRRIESPLKSTNMKELVDRFDANFVDEMDLDTLMRVLLAANYMDVKALLGLLCAKIASMMKGKTADQIRKTFNIRGEFTPEEEEEIRKDFKELLVE